jgi:nitrate reductase (cytochrome), electron transfer subunit
MKRAGSKLALIALVVALTASVSGYFMGLRQTSRFDITQHQLPALTLDEETVDRPPPAPTYTTLRERAHHRNAGWRTSLSMLPPAPEPQDTVPLTTEEREYLHARRGTRRAYDGAPPVVPHPIDQTSAASCLACHGQPTVIGGVSVAQISHPPYQNCLQCHAAGTGPGPGWTHPSRSPALTLAANDFVGTSPPQLSRRAFDDAPPVIPHPVWMRENCMSCHGAGGSSAVKPDHGGRQNCLQCHAQESSLQQQPLVATQARCADEMNHLPPALLAAIDALEP